MIRLTTNAFACYLVVICIADVATAQRSSVVIGESLADVKKPKSGKLDSPFGIDFDKQGNMYIVELSGGRVHKLDTAGGLTTIAGDGSKGYSGDNGPAKDATFNGMHNVAVTPASRKTLAWDRCPHLAQMCRKVLPSQSGLFGSSPRASSLRSSLRDCGYVSPPQESIRLGTVGSESR